MGSLLLHDPWVQFYLLLVGALWIIFIWDYYMGTQPTTRYDARPQGKEADWGKALAVPAADNKNLRRSVSRPTRRTD